MGYDEAINYMLDSTSCGLPNIYNSTPEFRLNVRTEISRAKCSIATAKVFLGFVEEKLNEGVSVKLDSTMLEAAIFIGNGMGLDPTHYHPEIRLRDSVELSKVANFRGKLIRHKLKFMPYYIIL